MKIKFPCSLEMAVHTLYHSMEGGSCSKLLSTVASLHVQDGDVTPVRDDQGAKISATTELEVRYLLLGLGTSRKC